MPTSSQARILSREDIADLQSLLSTRMSHHLPHQRSNEYNLPAGLFKPSHGLSLPHINLYRGYKSSSGGGSSLDDTLDPSLRCRGRLPMLESRVPHLICYPSRSQNGSFGDLSNNWPGDTEKPGTSVGQKESQDRKKSCSQSSEERKQSVPYRKMSRARSVERSQSLSRGTKRSSIKHSKKRAKESDDSDDSNSPEPINLEINLLAAPSTAPEEVSGSNMDAAVEAEPEPEPEATPKKLRIRNLFKQLLTIGMSSNAFRGVTLETSHGEVKTATEEEAGKALEDLASGIVGEDEQDESEEEEEDEDVELLMGSLLSDVGTDGCIHVPMEGQVAVTKPAAKPTTAAATTTAASEDVAKKLSSAVGLVDVVTTRVETEVEEVAVAPAIVHQTAVKKHETTAEEKAFLESVAAGSAFKGVDPKKIQQASKPGEKLQQHRKKVYKLPPVRLRSSVPPLNDSLLCIRTPNIELTHDQVKNMLEAQLGTIVSLQHDPEYLQYNDLRLPTRAMWIFKMEDTSETNYIKICMDVIIGYDGETLRIRKRDDVYNEEHRAFILVKQIQDEQAKRMKNKNKEHKNKARGPSAQPREKV